MARRALAAGDTLPLLARLWRDWLSPHRGTLAVVMLLIAVVGAATGLYPALIKAAFDAKAAELGIEDPHVVPISALKGDPALSKLTAVKNDAVVNLDGEKPIGTAGNPTALSLPYLIEDYVELLADAAGGADKK